MTHLRTAALALPLTLALASPGAAQDAVDLESDEAKVSYAIGLLIANQNAQQLSDIGIVNEAIIAGFTHGTTQEGTQMSVDEAMATFRDFQQAQQEKVAAENAARLAAEAEFLAENAKRDDVTVSPSGLQYKVDAEGAEDGESPTTADTVVVHYTGRLIDGTVFDSSVERGVPATFPVTGVIRGWTEALQLMKPGGKLEVWLPPELAYGPQSPSPAIPPNSVLTFEMELIEVLKP